MQGMMMDRPLLISSILEHAERTYGAHRIVARDTGPILWRYTYREMAARARRLANALRAMGVEPGMRVATLAWNDHRHLEAYFAVPGMGAVLHTCNPRLHVDQLAYVLNHAEDTVLMFDPALAQLVATVAPRCPKLRHYVCLSNDMPAVPSVPGVVTYEALLDASSDGFVWPEFDERTASGLCYTSGTTGNPKGVLYSHRSTVLHSLVLGGTQALSLSSRDTVMPVVPMFHVNAWGLPYGAPLNGCHLVLPGSRLDAQSLFELAEMQRVTCAAGVPTIWLALAQFMDQRGLRPTTLRRSVVGGSAMPAALIRTFAESFGVEVRHAWGMTETSPIGTISQSLDAPLPGDATDRDDGVADSGIGACAPVVAASLAGSDRCFDADDRSVADRDDVAHGRTMAESRVVTQAHPRADAEARYARSAAQGHAVFGVELALRAPDGARLPHDGQARGELMIRGPWIASGYFGTSPATSVGVPASPHDDFAGWFATGDVATIGVDGCMRITDRVKDVIKSGGEWISSIELESAALAHPAVLNAAVIGVPHPKWDERPHLFVVLRTGADVTGQALRDFLAERVAKWWLPESIEFVPDLPLGATGKVQKQALRAAYAARAD